MKKKNKKIDKTKALRIVVILVALVLVVSGCSLRNEVQTKSVLESGSPEYKVLRERNLENLEIAVNEWLSSGYELQGYIFNTGAMPMEYTQVVIRKGLGK